MSFRRSVAPISLLLVILACGGGSPPPTGPKASTVDDAGAETFAEVHPADLAELDAGGAAAPAAASTAPQAAAAPPPDECTPVGVDFEKRARPKLKECYAAAKKKEPNLEGTVRITVEISTMGKVKGTKVVEKTLPDAVAQCMLKVVKATPFPDAPKCWGKSLTIPMTFPTPK